MTKKLSINGVNLDMGQAKISLRRTNPMFELVGSYSLPFRIPRTKHNEQLLKLNNAAIYSPARKFDAVISLGSVPIYGELVVNEVNETSYETYFTTGNSSFRTKVGNVKLNELDYTEVIAGSAETLYTETLTAAAASTYPTYNYTCFPLLAPNYFGGVAFSYNSIINPWSYANTGGAGDPAKFSPYTGVGDIALYAPSFYLNFVIQKLFDLYGYSIETNEMQEDPEINTLVVTNMNTKGDQEYLKNYDLTFEDALPPITISEFMSSIESLFNVTFFISDLSRTVVIKKNTAIVKSIPKKSLTLLSRRIISEEEITGYKMSMVMDPDDDFSKLYDITKYTLGVTVDNYSDLTGGSYPASSYKDQLAYVTNLNTYYQSKLQGGSLSDYEWVRLTSDFHDKVLADKKKEVSTTANTLVMDAAYIYQYHLPSEHEHALFPRTDISAINSDSKYEYKTFDTLRLLFYRGIVAGGGNPDYPETINDSEYPLASSDVYRAAGTEGATPPSTSEFGRAKIPGANMSLRWDGTYGLFEHHWNDYIYWWRKLRKSAIDRYRLSLAEIFSLNFWEKYQADGVSILFRHMEIEIDFANDSVVVGDCEVYVS